MPELSTEEIQNRSHKEDKEPEPDENEETPVPPSVPAPPFGVPGEISAGTDPYMDQGFRTDSTMTPAPSLDYVPPSETATYKESSGGTELSGI